MPCAGWAGEEDVPPASPDSAKAEPFLARHFQILDATWGTRFRYMDNGEGLVTFRDQQYRTSTRLQINLDPKGRIYFQSRIESGSAFNSSWPNTGAGRARRQWVVNAKSLFWGLKFSPHAEMQVGGIEFDRGAGTEATYADNDGFLVGYRMRLEGKGQGWLPGKFSVTVGHVGDFKKPNFFSRIDRMGEANYVQVLAQKDFGEGRNRTASAEFDSIAGIQFLRGAMRWKKLPTRVLDDAQVEAIARTSDNPSFGWSARLGRRIDQGGRVRAGVIYSYIPTGVFDKNGKQVMLNGDAIVLGRRLGGVLRFAPFKNFTVSVFTARRLDSTPNTTRWLGQVVASYQFSSLFSNLLR